MKIDHYRKSVVLLSLCMFSMTVLSSGCCINIGDLCKAKCKRTEQLSAALAPGSVLAVKTEVGSITVTGADVADCSVTATICVKAWTEKEAKKLAEQVHIKLEPVGNTLAVKVEKPASLEERRLSIDFDIIAPRQTSPQLQCNVGKLSVSNITGRIEASANVGSVNCGQIAGDVDLRTNVGSIDIAYCEAAAAAINANATTNVGSISFIAPADFSAAVDASTQIGSIHTELPLTVTGKVGKSLHGTIGQGRARVRLSTNVGSIKIR